MSISLVTLIIILANVLISYKGFNDPVFFEKYKFNVAAVKNGQFYRLFTAGFLHVDMMHLLFNMLTFYFFADIVIQNVGIVIFLIIYLDSLLFGNLLSYIFHKNRGYYSAVGASGAVVGILYSAILFYPDMMLGIFFIIPMPAWLFGIAYLFFSIYGMKKQLGNIGHEAHFGGAIAGYMLTLITNPKLITTNLTIVLLMLVPIVFLFIMMKQNKI
ncbi:MAG TPA: rhomboid family intramembrane serine protease [Flavobacteriaceae bacterium]|nr:rhomboid family intramembrane serine protease [Flavobacteriaceae bacterium]